jgi:hypothetical protein
MRSTSLLVGVLVITVFFGGVIAQLNAADDIKPSEGAAVEKVHGAAILHDDGSIEVVTASSVEELHAKIGSSAAIPAEGEFHDTIPQNGWSTLVIRTNSTFNDT